MRPRLPFLIVLLLACAALVAHFSVDTGGAEARDGATAQRKAFTLELEDDGDIHALSTYVQARCTSGDPWGTSWSPVEGAPIHFRREGSAVWAREVAERTYPDGTLGRVAFTLRARVDASHDSAAGTVRLVTRFYRDGLETGACDSGPVPWAAGDGYESRLASAGGPAAPTGSYYPAVPSLAGRVSSERRRFIALVDRTCVATYRLMVAALRRTTRANYPVYVGWHAHQLAEIRELGPAPDGRRLYARWLANFSRRVEIERRAFELARSGDVRSARLSLARVGELKRKGNLIGQRFGLRRCTSNGADRTPVPLFEVPPQQGSGA